MLPPIAAVHANVNITVFFLDTYFFILFPPLNQIQCNIKSLPWLTRKATFIKHINSSFKKLKWFCSNYLPISRRSIWQQTIRQFFWLKFIVGPSLPGQASGKYWINSLLQRRDRAGFAPDFPIKPLQAPVVSLFN